MREDLEREFFRVIPSTFNVNDADINFSIRYANQFTEDDLPAIILNYIETGMESNIGLNKVESISDDSTEIFISDGDKLEYHFDAPEVTEIYKVEGYVNDAFQELDEKRYRLGSDGEKIVFESFEDLPDEGTKFYVYHRHREIKVELGGELEDRVQIDIVTSDYDDGTNFVNGVLLKKKATQEIMNKLRFGFDNDNMVIKEVTESSDLSSIEGGDYYYRNTFDVTVAYYDNFVEYYDSIKNVDYDISIEEYA